MNQPVPSRRDRQRACDLLRSAQYLLVEAAGRLGIGPEEGSLWTAVDTIVDVRQTHERELANR